MSQHDTPAIGEQNEKQYGLPTSADETVEHTTSYQGTEFTVRLRPPTISEMDEYENPGEELTWSQLYDRADKHLEKPELPPEDETPSTHILAYNQAIQEVGMMGASDFDQDVISEIEERVGDGAGN